MTTIKAHQYAMITNHVGKSFLVDCLISDTHTWDADISDSPSETGADTTDNIRNKPLNITMECVVSNNPLDVETLQRSEVTEPAQDCYDFLLDIRAAKQPVTIRTSLQTYERMALQSLGMPRRAPGTDGLVFEATWKEMSQVENKRFRRVAVPIAQGPSSSNGAAGEALTKVQVVKTRDGNRPLWYWFDTAIGGWRLYALPPFNTNVKVTPAVAEALEGLGRSSPFNYWEFTRDQPFGVAEHDWVTARKSDKRYREDIDAAFQQFGDTAANPYSLFAPRGLLPGLPVLLRYHFYFVSGKIIDLNSPRIKIK